MPDKTKQPIEPINVPAVKKPSRRRKLTKRPALVRAQRAVEIPEEFQAPYAHWTIKQRLWFRYLIQLKSPTEAAMRAYDCKHRQVASVIAHENLRKLNISMSTLLDIVGLDAEQDAKDLARLRKAKSKKFFAYEGEILASQAVDDYPTQIKALELTAKIKGLLKEETKEKDESATISFITNIIGSFNAAGSGEITPDVANRIGESISVLQKNLSTLPAFPAR